MRRVDSWERIAAIAAHCAEKKTKARPYVLSAYTVASYCNRLAAMGVTLKRHDEALCNGVDDADHARLMGARMRAENRLARISEQLGVTIEHQTDPRGATIKVWADKVEGRLLACF